MDSGNVPEDPAELCNFKSAASGGAGCLSAPAVVVVVVVTWHRRHSGSAVARGTIGVEK